MNGFELDAALTAAGVPATWYGIQGVRDPAVYAETYYFLATPSQGRHLVGIFERGKDRIDGSFTSEDDACQLLHDHLVVADLPVHAAPTDMRAAQKRIKELTKEVRNARKKSGSSEVRYQLQPGEIVDRFEGESGSLLYPDGTLLKNRSIPPSALNPISTLTGERTDYNRYRVEFPIAVLAGFAPPWFGQPGGAVTFRLDPAPFGSTPPLFSVGWLVGNRYLSRIASA